MRNYIKSNSIYYFSFKLFRLNSSKLNFEMSNPCPPPPTDLSSVRNVSFDCFSFYADPGKEKSQNFHLSVFCRFFFNCFCS